MGSRKRDAVKSGGKLPRWEEDKLHQVEGTHPKLVHGGYPRNFSSMQILNIFECIKRDLKNKEVFVAESVA